MRRTVATTSFIWSVACREYANLPIYTFCKCSTANHNPTGVDLYEVRSFLTDPGTERLIRKHPLDTADNVKRAMRSLDPDFVVAGSAAAQRSKRHSFLSGVTGGSRCSPRNL